MIVGICRANRPDLGPDQKGRSTAGAPPTLAPAATSPPPDRDRVDPLLVVHTPAGPLATAPRRRSDMLPVHRYPTATPTPRSSVRPMAAPAARAMRHPGCGG